MQIPTKMKPATTAKAQSIKALLVGINRYPTAPLRGCVNDVANVRNYLIGRGVPTQNITVMLDGAATAKNIAWQLERMLMTASEGETVLFHYSGHGAQFPRIGGPEADCLDEIICPVDFAWTKSTIISDKYFAQLFAAVPKKIKLIWISDSCHSGDLQRAMPQRIVSSPRRIMATNKQMLTDTFSLIYGDEKPVVRKILPKKINLDLVYISGCASDQTSADAYIDGDFAGALTANLFKVLRGNPKINAEKLLDQTKKIILESGYSQIPELVAGASWKKKPLF